MILDNITYRYGTRFTWRFPKGIQNITNEWIISEDIELNGLKWRFLFHPNYKLADEASPGQFRALLLELRSFVDEDVIARFKVEQYDKFEMIFKPFRQGTMWGSRMISEKVISTSINSYYASYLILEIEVEGKDKNYKPMSTIIKEKWIKTFEEQQVTDAMIRCNGKEIPIHKKTMAIISPVFKAMFEHELEEKQNGFVKIEDCDEKTVERAIMFIKNGDDEFINKLSYDDVKELFVFADKYDIELLKEVCVNGFKSRLTLKNSKDALEFAELFKLDENIIQMIKKYQKLLNDVS